MRFSSRHITAALLLMLPVFSWATGIHYHVEFEGIEDGKTLKEMKLASHLTSLKKRPLPSINALKYRADSDIPSLVKVLQANGYYEGKVTIQIVDAYDGVNVVVRVSTGPRYKLESFNIDLSCAPKEPCCSVSLEDIGIRLHKAVQTEQILKAELKAMQKLSECGFPLAKVQERDVIVDGKSKTVHVTLHIATEEKVDFGQTSISGNTEVKSKFIDRKIAWQEGEVYDSRLVDKTQNTLIDSGLFSSVLITHDREALKSGQLPLRVEVNETKHQSINVGASYQTVFGLGATFGWENKNVAGMGRTLRFQGDVTRISQTGVATYLHPDFKRAGQTMIIQAEASHENLFAYSKRSYSLIDRFERVFTRRLRGSIGLKGDRLFITASARNGNFWLIELPLYLRWSSANSLLNPTRGGTIDYTATPAFNSADVQNIYLTQQMIASAYLPLDHSERIVLAQKFTAGIIISNGLDAIPLSNRFLGGSEEDLRGYRYRTVSPVVDTDKSKPKPIGGRFALYYTLEARFRVTEVLGLVPFFDLGNVRSSEIPSLHGKWLKSTGLGFRFFTFMGPFRIDLAFPLNPRKKIDARYRILASIGQMF